MALIDMPFLPKAHPRVRQHINHLNRHWTRAVRYKAWLGCSDDEAAAKAGVSAEGLKQAMVLPQVKQAYIRACEEFRTNQIALVLHRLTDIAMHSENHMAAIKAAQLLMHPITGSEQGKQTTPGVVIQVMDTQTTDKATQVIDNATGPTEPDHT